MEIKAICFDLGETLIGLPPNNGRSLSWSNYYKDALEKGFYAINKLPSDIDYSLCIKILTKYNTRLNPREHEISSSQIFNEIKEILKLNLAEKNILENEFFKFFQRNNKLYDDTEEVLVEIKKSNIRTGILSDVPYGREKGFIGEDFKPIMENIDVILSSVNVGYRKPNITGYILLAEKLGIKTNEMVYVGNEEKDIIGANNAGSISVLINRTRKYLDYGEMYQFKNLLEMWHHVKKQIGK